MLTQSALAPGTAATYAELTDPARRPPALTEALPADTATFQPAVSVELDWKAFAANARSLARGVAADCLGTRNEHVRMMLVDDAETPDL